MNKIKTITIFGAESTGKTTLSKLLATTISADWKEEFARPYLEQTGATISTKTMNAIWQGQKKIQQESNINKLVIQDTDLYSTVGYWLIPHVLKKLGKCPPQLIDDASTLKSDLYLITQSNIPFEKNEIRYGGDKRESSDEFWVNICKKFNLNYVVLKSSDLNQRLNESINTIKAKGA